jgi:hypothetical protein
MEHTKQSISVWFFIGVLLVVYGVLIFGSGVYDLVSHAPETVALAHLHVAIWWGLLLLILGGIYTILFRPSRTKN